jgi:hypothetical protein
MTGQQKIIVLYRLCLTTNKIKAKLLKDFLDILQETKNQTNYEWRIFVFCDNMTEEDINLVKTMLPSYGQIIVDDFRAKSKNYSPNIIRNTIDYVRCIAQVDVLKSQNCMPNDIILFMEDDYVYNKYAISKAINFAGKYKNDFLSMYDHPNYYRYCPDCFLTYSLNEERKMALQFPMLHLASYIVYEFDHHWRTAVSTCYSFVCSYNALEILELTHKGISILSQVGFIGDYHFWRLIWDKGEQRLWIPIPGLAVHLGETNGHLPLKP